MNKIAKIGSGAASLKPSPGVLICPFMSGFPIPVAAPAGITTPGQQTIGSMQTPCAREKCAMFDGDEGLIYSQTLILGGMESIVVELQRLTEVIRAIGGK